jgi:signal transduction histidine kinase
MKIQQVFVIGMREELRSVLSAATGRAFPGVQVTPLETFAEAQARPSLERVVLVLIEPSPSVVAGAHSARDAGGLLRWPTLVIATKQPEPGVDWLPPEECDEKTLVRALVNTAEKHALARENARLRGDLLTVARRVNHDLRSSLNGVMTASEVIREIFGTEKPEDVELIQPVTDSAAEIARLMDQVSFIAKATAAPAVPQVLAMDELVWKGLSRVEARIGEKRAHVTHAEAWPMVTGVASWIETVWTNLILNAVEHGGLEPWVEVAWGERDNEFLFWVDDRGPGVPPEKRGALFTPFHRLADAGAIKGFGLAVVQRLVEMQGGRAGHEPREGGGSRFYFTLPR